MTFQIPISNEWGFPAASHPALVSSVFWILALLIGAGWCLIVALICNSLTTYDTEFSTPLFAMCLSSLVRYLSRSFAHFLIGWLLFWLSSFKCSLYVLVRFFIKYVFWKYFLPACGLSFHSLNCVFHRESFSLNEKLLIDIFFHGLCFWCCV